MYQAAHDVCLKSEWSHQIRTWIREDRVVGVDGGRKPPPPEGLPKIYMSDERAAVSASEAVGMGSNNRWEEMGGNLGGLGGGGERGSNSNNMNSVDNMGSSNGSLGSGMVGANQQQACFSQNGSSENGGNNSLGGLVGNVGLVQGYASHNGIGMSLSMGSLRDERMMAGGSTGSYSIRGRHTPKSKRQNGGPKINPAKGMDAGRSMSDHGFLGSGNLSSMSTSAPPSRFSSFGNNTLLQCTDEGTIYCIV